MFYWMYDVFLIMATLVLLPKLLLSKSWTCICSYLGFCLPEKTEKKGLSFLIYAVSVGETKAAASLLKQMKEIYPEASFFIASRTETGHEEAKRSLSSADRHFLLPIDFSWSVAFLLKRVKPDVLIFIEGDLWCNLIRLAKKRGTLICLVSGKISLKSYERFLFFSFLAKKFFPLFDLICAQNTTFKKRFLDLGADPSKVVSCGNIKFGGGYFSSSDQEKKLLKKQLGIGEGDIVIVAGSTHPGEEAAILKEFSSVFKAFPLCKLILVPRHPERFSKVKELVSKSSHPSACFSLFEKATGEEKVWLFDAMGKLLLLYQIADIAIVCGSFDKKLKGHNILEPIQANTPVLFGPYMSDQQDIVDLVLSFKAGVQVDLKDLTSSITTLLQNKEALFSLKKKGLSLLSEIREPLFATVSSLKSLISSHPPLVK